MEAIMVIVTLLLILLLLGIPILLIWLVINLFRKVPVKKQLRGIGICVAASILCTIINLSLVSSLPTPEEQAERQQRKEQLQAEKQAKQEEKTEKAINAVEKVVEKKTERVKKIEQAVIDNLDPLVTDTENASFTYRDMSVCYLKHSLERNFANQKCLVVYFNFSNDAEETKTFGWAFTVKAFQNGVELDNSIFHTDDNASKNSDREIQPGYTVNVAENFIIEDTSSPVNIEIYPLWSDRKLLEFTVNLK